MLAWWILTSVKFEDNMFWETSLASHPPILWVKGGGCPGVSLEHGCSTMHAGLWQGCEVPWPCCLSVALADTVRRKHQHIQDRVCWRGNVFAVMHYYAISSLVFTGGSLSPPHCTPSANCFPSRDSWCMFPSLPIFTYLLKKIDIFFLLSYQVLTAKCCWNSLFFEAWKVTAFLKELRSAGIWSVSQIKWSIFLACAIAYFKTGMIIVAGLTWWHIEMEDLAESVDFNASVEHTVPS